MNQSDVIREVVETAGEWLEHAENPDAMVSGILATKIVYLREYVDYLERRLENVSTKVRAY